jgi:hypothetical protein
LAQPPDLFLGIIPLYNILIGILAREVYSTTGVDFQNLLFFESVTAATLEIWAFQAAFVTVNIVPFYHPFEPKQ